MRKKNHPNQITIDDFIDNYKSNPYQILRNTPGTTAILFMLQRNQITESPEIFCTTKMALVHVSTSSYCEITITFYRKWAK